MIKLKNVTSMNGRLPDVRPYGEQIADVATLVESWDATTSRVTVSDGSVSALVNGAGAITMTQNDAGKRAAMEADVITAANGAMSPALKFDGSDHYLASVNPDFTSPFTLVALVKPQPAIAATQRIISRYGSAWEQTALRFEAGSVARFWHGTAVVDVDYSDHDGEWLLLVAACDGSYAKMSLNGAAPVVVATDNATGTATTVIGAVSNSGGEYFTGHLSRLHIHSGDLFASDAGLQTLSLYASLAQRAYGIGVGT